MILIVYCVHKLQADCRVTLWPPTDASSLPYCCSTGQHLSRGTRSYAFSKSTTITKTSFCILAGFLKDLLQSKNLVRGAATSIKSTLATFHFFDSTSSRYFLSKHLAYTFPGKKITYQ